MNLLLTKQFLYIKSYQLYLNMMVNDIKRVQNYIFR